MLLVLTTVNKNAEKLANRLVSESLAACVSVFPCRSVYRWRGKIKKAKEQLLLIKTRPDNYALLEKRIKELHPYDLPEILSLNAGGSMEYIDWVLRESRPKAAFK
jgi:periplasmic divalent cation tolerance protein